MIDELKFCTCGMSPARIAFGRRSDSSENFLARKFLHVGLRCRSLFFFCRGAHFKTARATFFSPSAFTLARRVAIPECAPLCSVCYLAVTFPCFTYWTRCDTRRRRLYIHEARLVRSASFDFLRLNLFPGRLQSMDLVSYVRRSLR